MRIGINALYWIPNAMGGTEAYFLNLTKNLVVSDPKSEFVVFLNSDAVPHFNIHSSNLSVQCCPIPGRLRPLRLLWENTFFPSFVSRHRLDLLHSLGYLGPSFLSLPSVVTVLDMIHYVRPSDINTSKRILWRLLFPRSLKRADRVISISHSVKNDITRFFPWAESKISPIHLAVDHDIFRPQYGGSDNKLTSPFILAVSSLSYHKNLDGLLRAFTLVRDSRPDLQLVLVGIRSNASDRLRWLANELSIENNIKFTGRICNRELVKLYQTASVFVFPSHYEGFGLPVLEAMACGCPVVAANRYSIPEVAGDAAILVDPENIIKIAKAIQEIVSSPGKQMQLSKLGLQQASTFHWADTAQHTLGVYRQTIANSKR